MTSCRAYHSSESAGSGKGSPPSVKRLQNIRASAPWPHTRGLRCLPMYLYNKEPPWRKHKDHTFITLKLYITRELTAIVTSVHNVVTFCLLPPLRTAPVTNNVQGPTVLIFVGLVKWQMFSSLPSSPRPTDMWLNKIQLLQLQGIKASSMSRFEWQQEAWDEQNKCKQPTWR